MKNVSYTKIFSALIASGLFVFTLTNSSVVFSQASEASGLGEVFKKVQQFELLAAVGDSEAPAAQEVTGLSETQVLAKFRALEASGKSGKALLESFLNSTEGKAQQDLFLKVAKDEMPGQERLIAEVAYASGFLDALVLATTGFNDTGAGDDQQEVNSQQDVATQNGNSGVGAGGAPSSQPTSPTSSS